MILNKYENLFDTIEVTSYEPALLRLIQECSPEIIPIYFYLFRKIG
ncbi:MAG: hypothetical protein ACFFCY_05930 [Promethearchaeota archaeon]